MCLSVHQKCSNYALTNLLFGLCRFVWIIDPLVTRPNPHPGAPAHPSTFEMLRAKECTPAPYPSTFFTFGFAIKFGGVSKHLLHLKKLWTIYHFMLIQTTDVACIWRYLLWFLIWLCCLCGCHHGLFFLLFACLRIVIYHPIVCAMFINLSYITLCFCWCCLLGTMWY
jgi:hypothetical protein